MKDNMGYDLRHLLIGSEGTLGIITAASLRLYPMPAEAATRLDRRGLAGRRAGRCWRAARAVGRQISPSS